MMETGDTPAVLLRAGEIELDLHREIVRFKGQDTGLRGRNYEVLLLLMQRAPDLVTKDEILDTVWKNIPVTEGVIPTALKTIRKEIGDTGRQSTYIETRYGRGYRFTMPVTGGEAVPTVGGSETRSLLHLTRLRSRPLLAGGVALIAGAFAIAVYLASDGRRQNEPLLQTRIDPAFTGLEAPLHAEMLSRGLLDAAAAPRRFDLHIGHSDQDGGAAVLTLTQAVTGEALDVRSIPLAGLGTEQLARRIAIENSNILRCADLLAEEARRVMRESARLFPELVRLCRALMISGNLQDPVRITRRMLEQASDSPFLMSLHALVITTQPNRYFFGRTVGEAQRIREEATSLAEQAREAQPESDFVRSAYILSQLDTEAPLQQLNALSGIPVESWAGFYATAQTAVVLRQVGRINEARFLSWELESRWPAIPQNVIGHAILAATANNWTESRDILAGYLSLYPESVQVSRLMMSLSAFYGSDGERDALVAEPSLPADIRTCFDVPASLTPDAAHIDRISNACRALDVSVSARQLARIGETSAALDILEGFDPSSPGIAIIFYYPELAAVRETERFSVIAEAFGLLDYWRESGALPDFCYQQIDAPVCMRAVFE